MGLPIRNLHATNIGDKSGEILLSKWIPEKRDDGKFYMPKDTPIGLDMFVKNVLDLKQEEGTVEVEIIPSNEDTGLYLLCFDDYFGDEQHLFDHMPPLEEGTYKVDWIEEDDIDGWNLHVATDIKMKNGDKPINVTLRRK